MWPGSRNQCPARRIPQCWPLLRPKQRAVVTSDTDFGELAYRSRLPAQCGVVLIRIDWTQPDGDNQVVVAALTSRDSCSGLFAEAQQVRAHIKALQAELTSSLDTPATTPIPPTAIHFTIPDTPCRAAQCSFWASIRHSIEGQITAAGTRLDGTVTSVTTTSQGTQLPAQVTQISLARQ
jgi:hypothetical protein